MDDIKRKEAELAKSLPKRWWDTPYELEEDWDEDPEWMRAEKKTMHCPVCEQYRIVYTMDDTHLGMSCPTCNTQYRMGLFE